MANKVCPVCTAPSNEPCHMCAESMALILQKTLPVVKPPMASEVKEQANKLINICSGEDVCMNY